MLPFLQLRLLSKYFFLVLIIMGPLISCEHLFEQHPTYSYDIKNNTSMLVKINITSPTIANKASINHPIAPGTTLKIWEDTDYDDDSYVYDREKLRKEVTGFRIESIFKNGVLIATNPNIAKRWSYDREQRNKATYTFILEETDF